MRAPHNEVRVVGLLVVSLRICAPPVRALVAELARRFTPNRVEVGCIEGEMVAELSSPVASDASPGSTTVEVLIRALSKPPPALGPVQSRLERDQPGVVAVWAEAEELVLAHRVLKAIRISASANAPADMDTALVGPRLGDHLADWVREPARLRVVMEQVGQYIVGDPIVGLEALVRDRFRVEARPWLLPGVFCLERLEDAEGVFHRKDLQAPERS